MDARHAIHYEALLLEERARALDALHRIEAEEEEPQAYSSGDTVRGQKEMADAASDTQEEEADFASATRLSERLAEVDTALVLLREDPARFSTCEECGRKIGLTRLELLPWSRRCSACARLGEGALAR
jgi:RNA polymerase-binding transcription factor DksA